MENILKYKQQSEFFAPLRKSPFGGFRGLMAFKQKVKESYHFPQNNGNNARLINIIDESINDKSDLINNTGNDELFKLYPNPNQGVFTLEYNNQDTERSYFTIIDFTGKIVYQKTLIKKQGKETINMTHLPTGIYFVRINNTDGKLLYSNKLSIIK